MQSIHRQKGCSSMPSYEIHMWLLRHLKHLLFPYLHVTIFRSITKHTGDVPSPSNPPFLAPPPSSLSPSPPLSLSPAFLPALLLTPPPLPSLKDRSSMYKVIVCGWYFQNHMPDCHFIKMKFQKWKIYFNMFLISSLFSFIVFHLFTSRT